MKKLLIILFMFQIVFCFAETIDFTVHYHRYEGDYTDWGLHLWGAVEEDSGTFIINGISYDWFNALPFQTTDDYGMAVTFPVDDAEALGFIVHKGDEKDPPGLDRSFSDYDVTHEIWLLQGIAEIYTSEPSTSVRMQSIFGDGINALTIQMTGNITDYETRFEVYKNGYPDGSIQTISNASIEGTVVTLTLEDAIDITSLYEVYDTVGELNLAVIHNFPSDEYVYDGNDLGFTYSPSETIFKLWAPTASAVNVLIYENPSGEDDPVSYEMTRIENGVLECTISEDLKNKYYHYELTIAGDTKKSCDPYSKGLSANTERSLVFDPEDTNPEDWENDEYVIFEEHEDAIIWEVHIRDLTYNETWNGPDEMRGKFLGVVEEGTTYEGEPTGFDHILDLGVNTVQILPMYDFASVDETNPDSRNWGYDPYAYNVPEGSYSSNPDGIARNLEMKQMIKKFHDNGIKVIMDVVYNHTYSTGDGSLFDLTVPKYYYQLDSGGDYCNYSGCGNVTDTAKPMVKNFIINSCKYWVEEYHIDGFRFDLMGLIETDVMESVVEEITAINPDALIYGEPWGGWGAPILTGKGDQRGLGFGCFNDNIRNGIRGDTDGTALGYVMGQTGNWSAINKGIDGAINDFTDDPEETINYFSAHDNYTWWDKLERSVTSMPDEALIRMNKFGAAVLFTSQGIPFLHAGSEFLRTKRAPGATEEQVRNSYNANDEVNKLDWERKSQNMDVVNYYKGMIELRKNHKEFRLRTKEDIENYLHIEDNSYDGAMIFTIDDITPEDDWGDIYVAYNPTNGDLSLPVPPGSWNVVVDEDEAGNSIVSTGVSSYYGTSHYESYLTVPSYSAKVMYKSSNESLSMNIFQNPVLDKFLHFAVNSEFDPGSIELLVNNEEVVLDEIAENSWYGSYEMTTTGDAVFSLNTDNESLSGYFGIGKINDEINNYTFFEDNIKLEIPQNSNEQYFAVFDNKIKPALNSGVYEIGLKEFAFEKNMNVMIKGDIDQAVYQKINEEWIELSSSYEDGYVKAETKQMGLFKLGIKNIYGAEITSLKNYPNPFNPNTKIQFKLSKDQYISLDIYNVKGQFVRNLIKGKKQAGLNTVEWNGKTQNNSTCASGIYFLKLKSENETKINKMLLLK